MNLPENNYIREHSSAAPEALEWIEKQTHIRTNYPRMLSGPVQGRFLKMLVEISGAKKVLEIGSFTGYSSCWMALGLPEDGHIDALEINDKLEDLMREGWQRAGVSDKIHLHIVRQGIGIDLPVPKGIVGHYESALAKQREA